MKKKKSKKKIRYVDSPMRWNPGAHKYEVDLPGDSDSKSEVVKQDFRLWKFILFLIMVLLLTGILSWLISFLIN